MYCARCYAVYACLLFTLWLTTAQAQTDTPYATALTTANGLPHNAITGMVQDRAGFLWIATADGLARYDGRTVRVFRNRPGDNASLADNSISTLEPTATDSMLVVSGAGNFQLFDPLTERFTTLLDAKFLARNGLAVLQGQLTADARHLWALMPGIRLIDYDRYQKKIRSYDVPRLVGSVNQMHDFILTETACIYGECLTGLFQFNTRTGRKRVIPFPYPIPTRLQDQNFWSGNHHRVVEGPDGQIAVFGYHVVALYDPVRDRFRTIPIPDDAVPPKADSGSISVAVKKFVIPYALKTLSDKQLYLGYMNRVYRLDATSRLTPVPTPNPLANRATPWLIDRSGVLWVSGDQAGLTRINLRALPFGFAATRKSFAEDLVEQNLGVTLPDSFEVWPKPRWPRYNASADQRSGYLIDPSRVYRYVPARRVLTEIRSLKTMYNQTCCKLCLKASRQGSVWVYNNRLGLIEVRPDGRLPRLVPNSQLPMTRPQPGYDAGDIQPLGQSVWVGSQYGLGLFRYDLARQRFDQPLVAVSGSGNSLPSNTINCLSADPTDSLVLWIGTAGGGLCRLDTRTMRFRRLGEPEGFPNGSIQSIESDRQGRLWVATNQGLICLKQAAGRAKKLTWRHFTTADGLAENAFLQTSSACLPDGRLVFGTPTGRVIFDPRTIHDDGYEPPIVLTSLAINNRPVETNEPGSPLPVSLNGLPALDLDHTQNFLTIAFAGLHYGKTGKLTYRHQLTGVDDHWVSTGNQNTANYTQLAPGRYLFRVNSTTADGFWSHRIKELTIVIRPPFWATWWAYFLYFLVFGGLVLGFIRFRIGQAQQQQEIVLKRREAEQLRAVDEVKTRFFANITHEFRTPLTLILSPTETLLNKQGQDMATRRLLNSVYQNAGQLLRLINQLLDLSKLEASSMALSLVRGNAVLFINRLVDLFYPMAVQQTIALRVDIAAPLTDYTDESQLFDADKWEKIITNLLSNALKFTPAGGQVVLTIDQPAHDQLRLRLADTGIGIPASHLPHIFDRFYQVDTSRTRAYEGTGIGLALTKELTDLLGGTIAVESRTEAPAGTTFTLTLPLLPASARPDAPVVAPSPAPASRPDAGPPLLADNQSVPVGTTDTPLVLIVDDNDELRTFVAGELTSRYRVLTAADGEEGWQICQRELPDVVLTDVMMPRMDGFQLTHCIKSTPATNHIAVILLTARAAQSSRIEGLEQGADDYLTKPFHVDELCLRLDNLLIRHASLRAHLYRQLSAPATPANEPVVDPFIIDLHRAIEARLDDTTFGVDDLAQAVSMSRRTLNRKLAATTSMAASDVIRQYRLQRATELLQSGRSIAETAYAVGFDSPGYFATVFKQAYQQTPSEFVSRQRI